MNQAIKEARQAALEQWESWAPAKRKLSAAAAVLVFVAALNALWYGPTQKMLAGSSERLAKAQSELDQVKAIARQAVHLRQAPKGSRSEAKAALELAAKKGGFKLEQDGSFGAKALFAEAAGSDIAQFLESVRMSGRILPSKAAWTKSAAGKWSGYVEFSFPKESK